MQKIKELDLKRKAFGTRFIGSFVIKGKVNDTKFEIEDNAGRRNRRHPRSHQKTNIETLKFYDESVSSDFWQSNNVDDKKTVTKSYPIRDRKKI